MVKQNDIYTFNPNKKPYVNYTPKFAFKVVDIVENRVWLQNVEEEHHVVLKTTLIMEHYWYKHTQREIDNYHILYGET